MTASTWGASRQTPRRAVAASAAQRTTAAGTERFRERVFLHQLVSGLLRLLLGGLDRRHDAPAVPGPVRFLLWDLYETGGSLRSNLLLAGHLAEHRPTEIVSLLRTAETTFFPVPENLPVRVLHDRRPQARRGLLQRLTSRLPSVLMHPDDRAISSYSLWTDLQLLRLLRSLEGGVVITTRPALHLFASRFCRPGVVVVAREHDNFTTRTPAVREGLSRLSSGLDAISVLNDGDRRDYAHLLGDRGVHVFHLPNALQPLEGEAAPVREDVVVAAGRLTPQKGFDLLIEAFAAVAARHPAWSLRIYGQGSRRDELEQQVRDLGLTGRVTLLPPTQSLGVVMGQAAMFVLSSRYEGFGRVLIEAMSKGLPIVSFDCPRGPSDIITHGHDGLLVPAEDVGALSRAMLALVEDRQLRERLGRAGPSSAAQYDIESIGASWREELDALVAARNGEPRQVDPPARAAA